MEDVKHEFRNFVQIVRQLLVTLDKHFLESQAVIGKIANRCGQMEDAVDGLNIAESPNLGLMANPTGLEIRNDAGGDGHYGASRKKIINSKTIRYAHPGEDRVCKPGQEVAAVIGGIIPRIARPYLNKDFSGLLIVGKSGKVKMFYLEPFPELIGKHVEQGQVIGIAQDISKKYPDVIPHIHTQILEWNPGSLII